MDKHSHLQFLHTTARKFRVSILSLSDMALLDVEWVSNRQLLSRIILTEPINLNLVIKIDLLTVTFDEI